MINKNRLIKKYIENNKKNKDGKENIIIVVIILLIIVLLFVGVLIIKESNNIGRSEFIGGGGAGGSSVVSSSASGANVEEVLSNMKRINNGVIPEITYGNDGIPTFIDGKYSDIIVRDFSSAIMSINEIKELMHIQNPSTEYSGIDVCELATSKIYRFQQMVSGVPVYDKQLFVETDKEGNITALGADYDANLSLSTYANIGKPDINTPSIVNTGYTKVFSSKLYVYNYGSSPVLTWCVDIGKDINPEKRIFFSANDGSIISAFDMADYDEINAIDLNGNQRTFSATKSYGGFNMIDTQRGITIYDCNGTENGNVAISNQDAWSDAGLVSCAANVRDVYDFYKNTYKPKVFRNGRLSQIEVKVGYRPADVSSEYSNASSSTFNDYSKAVIRIGDGKGYMQSMDVMTHEFTHAILHASCNLSSINESGAINEAYCDIIGVLFENIQTNGDSWIYGKALLDDQNVNLASPNKTGQPNKIGDRHMKSYCLEQHDHTVSGCDNGGIHKNCGIINRAAYLMYKNGITDYKEIAKLFIDSMDYLVPSSDFKMCRAAIIHAAKINNLDEDKILIIINALKAVGIEGDEQINVADISTGEALNGTITGKVASANTMNPLSSADISSTAIDGSNNEADSTTDSAGLFSQALKKGIYRLKISLAGYRTCIVNNIEVKDSETTYIENAILLDEVSGNPKSKAGGKITNAVTGEGVSGATVHFIPDWGNNSGDYARDSEGNIIVLYSNENGEYYTDQLSYGYYTGEITMPGYSTQYVNLIASNEGNITSSQNVVLSPEANNNEYRITLEWDESPQDLDAHIKGNKPSDFHVFFTSKKAEFNGENIAILDHDDTAGNGFETITLKTESLGEYSYFVYQYSDSGSLANSNARVKIYKGNVMVEQYNVPTNQGGGKYWSVFKIKNDQIVSVNKIIETEP